MKFILAQKAISEERDKYVCVSDPTITLYVPQYISRSETEPNQLDIESCEKKTTTNRKYLAFMYFALGCSTTFLFGFILFGIIVLIGPPLVWP